MRLIQRHGWLIGLLLAGTALSVGPARADDKQDKAAQARALAEQRGHALFTSSAAWIRGQGRRIGKIERAHLRFADVQFDDPDAKGNHGEGYISLWFEGTTRFRKEARQTRTAAPSIIKVLDGSRGWIWNPKQKQFKRQHGSGGLGAGTEAIAQLKRDVEQLANLARFLTPTSLDGAQVTWTFEGTQTLPAPLAPKALPALARVRRDAPGEPPMLFFFQAAPAQSGAVKAGHHPYAVFIQADAQKRQRAEWFVLDRWRRKPGQRAQPARIRGFAAAKGKGGLRRFVLLFPEHILLNRTLHPDTFRGKRLP